MRIRVATGVVAALLAISCGDTPPPTAPTPAAPTQTPSIRISGKVVDYSSGQGVAGATVTWRAVSGNHLNFKTDVVTTSDSAGQFTVNLPVTEGLSVADRIVFESPLSSGVIRVPVKHLETDLLVNGGPCAARYGYVRDAITGHPIGGARVLRAGSAMTDANGYYRIDIGCTPYGYERWGIGTTTISASHPAYQSTYDLDGRSENTSFSGIRRVDFGLQPLP